MANTDLKKFAQVAESIKIAFHVMGMGTGAGASLVGEGNSAASNRAAPILFKNLPPQQRDFVAVTSELTTFAQEAGLQGDISVNMNMEGIIISLSNALIFEPGSAELRPESIGTLHEIAELLKQTDNPVRVEGHTDNIPTNNPLYPTNWELSVARAVTIVRYLAEEEDVPPARLSAAGNAEFKPVTANDSRANRALNRRADIIIIYPTQSRQFSLGVSSTPSEDSAGKNGQ
jgi:chemotaxis protein MotB